MFANAIQQSIALDFVYHDTLQGKLNFISKNQKTKYLEIMVKLINCRLKTVNYLLYNHN